LQFFWAASIFKIELSNWLNELFSGCSGFATFAVVNEHHQQQNNDQGHKKACEHHDDELFWGLNQISVLVAHKNLSFDGF
jgi:hypothetical protein